MPLQKSNFQFDSHASTLLVAIRAPVDLTGTAAAIPILSSCLQAAAELWPTDSLIKWALVPRLMQSVLRAPSNSQSVLHLYSALTEPSEPFKKFVAWRAPTERTGLAFEAHALLGRAIACCAASDRILPGEFLSGLVTIRRASRGRAAQLQSAQNQQCLRGRLQQCHPAYQSQCTRVPQLHQLPGKDSVSLWQVEHGYGLKNHSEFNEAPIKLLTPPSTNSDPDFESNRLALIWRTLGHY